MGIKAVIFDMGGVILRTEDTRPREELAAGLGLSRLQLEDRVWKAESSLQADIGAISEDEHWGLVLDRLAIPRDQLQVFREKYWSGDREDEHLIAFLHSLRPNYRTGLLSNAWSGIRLSVSENYHFLEAFDTTIFSAEVGMRKPEPGIYLHILNILEVEPQEAVFLDDFPENIEGARELGIQAVLFRNPRQAQDDIKSILDAGDNEPR
jgi:HAD superfamily hydrolase (TIGR01509 family)